MNEADAAARKIREAAERTETRRSQCQSRLEKAAVLLEACLKNVRGLKLREVRRTEAGGLLPWVFVIDREPGDFH